MFIHWRDDIYISESSARAHAVRNTWRVAGNWREDDSQFPFGVAQKINNLTYLAR